MDRVRSSRIGIRLLQPILCVCMCVCMDGTCMPKRPNLLSRICACMRREQSSGADRRLTCQGVPRYMQQGRRATALTSLKLWPYIQLSRRRQGDSENCAMLRGRISICTYVSSCMLRSLLDRWRQPVNTTADFPDVSLKLCGPSVWLRCLRAEFDGCLRANSLRRLQPSHAPDEGAASRQAAACCRGRSLSRPQSSVSQAPAPNILLHGLKRRARVLWRVA